MITTRLLLALVLFPLSLYAGDSEACWDVVWNKQSYCVSDDPFIRSQEKFAHQQEKSKAPNDRSRKYRAYFNRSEELKDLIEDLNKQRKPVILFYKDKAGRAKAQRHQAHNEALNKKVKDLERERLSIKEKMAQLPSQQILEIPLERLEDLYDVAVDISVRDRLVPLYHEKYRLEDFIYIGYPARDLELRAMLDQIQGSRKRTDTVPCYVSMYEYKRFEKEVRKQLEDIEARRCLLYKEKTKAQQQVEEVRQSIRVEKSKRR
ncbi:MAG: hypothetical protein F4201_07510 [Nitrospira sp. SB0677_bin_15]|nr:hypothetical protein [Nitrospira sp. SB0677_bin_15]